MKNLLNESIDRKVSDGDERFIAHEIAMMEAENRVGYPGDAMFDKGFEYQQQESKFSEPLQEPVYMEGSATLGDGSPMAMFIESFLGDSSGSAHTNDEIVDLGEDLFD